MKKSFLSVLLVILILLSACSGGYSVMNPRTSASPDVFAMSYSKFNGKKSDIVIAPWDNAELTIHIVTEAGSLSLEVAPENDRDKPLSRWDNLATADFTYKLPESGAYFVTLEAKDHRGSYWIEVLPTK